MPTPSRTEIAEVTRRTAGRIERILKKHGRALDPGLPGMIVTEPSKLSTEVARVLEPAEHDPGT